MRKKSPITIPYHKWMEEAFISVAKKTIQYVIKHGLTDGHYLSITLRTDHPAVTMAASLKKRYPETMTIFLRDRYKNLKTHDDAFAVTLSFGNIQHRLTIPYQALEAMHDPYAQVQLFFKPQTPKTTKKDATIIQLPSLTKKTPPQSQQKTTKKPNNLIRFQKPKPPVTPS